MTLYDMKPAFQDLLRPACAALARAGVTANQVTIGAMLLSILTGMMLVLLQGERWVLWLVPLTLLVRMALNAIDGMLAREHGMQSALGGLLNELGDVISDIALYAPFALIAGISPLAVSTVVVLAVVSEMAGVLAVQIGASRRYDGPMGKSDRALTFGLLALLLGLGMQPGAWANVVLAAVALLLVATIVNRARAAVDESKPPGATDGSLNQPG